jgi:hypothetical protein
LLYCDDYTKENKLKDIELKIINNNYDKNEKYIQIEPITEKINNLINEIYNNKDNNDNDNNNDDDNNDNNDDNKDLEKKDIIKKINIIKKYEYKKNIFFNNYDDFLKFSSLMKYFNLYDEYNEFNKSQKGYDEKNNLNIFKYCEPANYINWFIMKYNDLEGDFYKQLIINEIKSDKIINDEKLNYKMLISKINLKELKNKIIYDNEQFNNNDKMNNIYVKNKRIETIKLKIKYFIKKIITDNLYEKYEIEITNDDIINFIKNKIIEDIDDDIENNKARKDKIIDINFIKELEEDKLYYIYYDRYINKDYHTSNLYKINYDLFDIKKLYDEIKKIIIKELKYNFINNLLDFNNIDLLEYEYYYNDYFTFDEINKITNILKIDNKYINYDNLENILNYIQYKYKKTKQIIINSIIKSDTGTGKTTTFINLVKYYNFKFICIVSRVSLADSLYKDMISNSCFSLIGVLFIFLIF